MALRVVSYNILEGGGDRYPLIAMVLRSLDPDVIALLEANSRQNAERLADDLGMDLAYGEANSEYAVAWLSRLPILRWHNHRLPVLAKTLLELEIPWAESGLGLFATHLVHGRSEEDGLRRAEEVRAILRVMESLGSRPHLLVGDLNALHPDDPVGSPPPGEEVGHLARVPVQVLLEAGYVDCYRKLQPSGESGYTYSATHPWLRLDYAFASPSLASDLAACGVAVDSPVERASDHRPVWVDLA